MPHDDFAKRGFVALFGIVAGQSDAGLFVHLDRLTTDGGKIRRDFQMKLDREDIPAINLLTGFGIS